MNARRGLVGALASICALIWAIAATGCAAASPVSVRPQALSLAFSGPNTVDDPLIDWFARSVFVLSHGQLAIRVVPDCCGDDLDAEQNLVLDVARHRFDLGWAPTTAFESLGVDAARALTAPMLIDSYRLEQAVVGSSLTDGILSDARSIGVVGLAIEPGYLERPITTWAAGGIRSLSDWRRMTFSTVGSSEEAAAVSTLGAMSVRLAPAERDAAFARGGLQGYAASIASAGSNANLGRPDVTDDIALWPRLSMLIGSPDALTRLTVQQRAWMEDAAAATRGRTADLRSLEIAAQRNGCAAGTHYIAADLRDVAAMRLTLEPVYADIESADAARRIVAEIRTMAATTPPDESAGLPPGCG